LILSVAGTGSIDYLDVNAGAVFAGAIDMGSNRINNLTDPSSDQDAATKAYVDAQLTSQDLDMSSDSGSGSIDLDSQTLTIAGTADEIETSFSGQTLTIGLPDDVTVSASFTAENGQFNTDLNVGLGILTVEDGNFSVGTVADFSDTLNVQGAASFENNVTITGSLAFDTNSNSIDRILDEDDMTSDSATALATQQSIKAYVDAQVTAQDLDMASDSAIAGTSNEIETSFSGQTLTIGLPDSVTITSDLTVNGNTNLGNDQSVDSVTFNAQLLAASTNVDIGSDANRFGDVYATNVYTGDFHMKNERGDWTLFEESDHIRIRNNATGQEFKLDMTPVEE
jgi:hypothetical protein